MMTALADALDESRFGGKAVQLGASLRAGLPVPPGVALDVDTVQAIATGNEAALDHAARSTLGLAMLAVRSSAVGEDGAGASFAGQHSTVLDVRGRDALRAAIRQVWDSGHTPSALAYRARMGLGADPRMAIVLQMLVASDIAGVMFTRNPLSGEDERVIEASWGLGEVVVAGLVTPDRYRLARSGAVLERSAGEKDIAIRSLAAGGTAEHAVAPELVEALCLDDAQLARLGELAQLCERYHGPGPHDLEFAFEGEALFLLQCRAITRTGAR